MKSFTTASLLLSMSVALLPTIASAQSVGGFGNSGDNRDPFNRASTGDTSGLMQLLNQAQLNSNNSTYGSQQQQQLNSATTDFRTRQLEAIKAQNKKTAPVTNVKSSQ